MMEILSKAGLDPKKWIKCFKSIGAKVPVALEFLGPSHFNELSKFADTPIEIVALKKFLGVPDNGQLLKNVGTMYNRF